MGKVRNYYVIYPNQSPVFKSQVYKLVYPMRFPIARKYETSPSLLLVHTEKKVWHFTPQVSSLQTCDLKTGDRYGGHLLKLCSSQVIINCYILCHFSIPDHVKYHCRSRIALRLRPNDAAPQHCEIPYMISMVGTEKWSYRFLLACQWLAEWRPKCPLHRKRTEKSQFSSRILSRWNLGLP
jgi:hypothetical protein